ncbi:hypothetical protein ACFQGT_00375 [Natrialbaceae archaeon GCM10025810]
MSIQTAGTEKGSDDSTENSDVALIDEQTIRRLEDEPDDDACRFAAVARSLEQIRVPNTQFRLPTTVVAYVDGSGRFGVEREFFGHRPDWHEIPRTIAVTDASVPSRIPREHTERYRPVLELYAEILDEE